MTHPQRLLAAAAHRALHAAAAQSIHHIAGQPVASAWGASDRGRGACVYVVGEGHVCLCGKGRCVCARVRMHMCACARRLLAPSGATRHQTNTKGAGCKPALLAWVSGHLAHSYAAAAPHLKGTRSAVGSSRPCSKATPRSMCTTCARVRCIRMLPAGRVYVRERMAMFGGGISDTQYAGAGVQHVRAHQAHQHVACAESVDEGLPPPTKVPVPQADDIACHAVDGGGARIGGAALGGGGEREWHVCVGGLGLPCCDADRWPQSAVWPRGRRSERGC